jgi:hypothetical protein
LRKPITWRAYGSSRFRLLVRHSNPDLRAYFTVTAATAETESGFRPTNYTSTIVTPAVGISALPSTNFVSSGNFNSTGSGL